MESGSPLTQPAAFLTATCGDDALVEAAVRAVGHAALGSCPEGYWLGPGLGFEQQVMQPLGGCPKG
jgi:hypothetical protein